MGGVKVKFIFYLQRFGGGSQTTVTEREPTPEERRIINTQADIAEAYAPNAKWLNDVARSLLQDSYGTVQTDFNNLNQNAQNQIAASIQGLTDIINSNNQSAQNANNDLQSYKNQLSDTMNYLNKEYLNMIPNAKNAGNEAQAALTDDMYSLDDALQTYQSLLTSRPYSDTDLSKQGIDEYTATGQGGLIDLLNAYRTQSGEYAQKANSAFDGDPTKSSTSLQGRGFVGANDEAYQTVLNELGGLQNGDLPSNYLQNMTDAIKNSTDATVGNLLNNLAQRGVLNSSVTTQALNDVEGNVTNALAQNYLQNIGQLESLAQNKFQDAINASSETAGLANQQYQNNLADLNNRLNITGQMTDLHDKYLDSWNNRTMSNADLATQRLNNATTASNNLQSIYGAGANNTQNSLSTMAGWTQNQNSNTASANNSNANIYSNVGIGQASAPLTTAAAAQEAAQQPAINLWNASIGLTGSNNGTLSALAGSSGKTTTTQSGGGGFLSGLFGGLF